MAKKPHSHRKAKLKERRKRAAAPQSGPSLPAGFLEEFDGPLIAAEVLTDERTRLARLEEDNGDWTAFNGDTPVGGSSDPLPALRMLLAVASEFMRSGQRVSVEVEQLVADAIEEECEAAEMEWDAFLLSLYPPGLTADEVAPIRLMQI